MPSVVHSSVSASLELSSSPALSASPLLIALLPKWLASIDRAESGFSQAHCAKFGSFKCMESDWNLHLNLSGSQADLMVPS